MYIYIFKCSLMGYALLYYFYLIDIKWVKKLCFIMIYLLCYVNKN